MKTKMQFFLQILPTILVIYVLLLLIMVSTDWSLKAIVIASLVFAVIVFIGHYIDLKNAIKNGIVKE